jgi:hypothetical protein
MKKASSVENACFAINGLYDFFRFLILSLKIVVILLQLARLVIFSGLPVVVLFLRTLC